MKKVSFNNHGFPTHETHQNQGIILVNQSKTFELGIAQQGLSIERDFSTTYKLYACGDPSLHETDWQTLCLLYETAPKEWFIYYLVAMSLNRALCI